MSTTSPRVALIIVAYGHAAILPPTLAALEQLDDLTDPYEIIVVENGDGSSAQVVRHWHDSLAINAPHLRIIEPGLNLGFAGGCNAAVAATTAELIVLINPDLQPQPNFVRHIVAPLDDPRIGVVGAKLFYPDRQTLQHAGGYLQSPLLLAQHHGYGEHEQGSYDVARDVEFVTGAALAMRRDTWISLGGMDQAFYPAYYEDVDLCWRARQRGLIVRYEPRAVAIHQESAGIARASEQYHRLYHRNRIRLLFKHCANTWLHQQWLPAELAHLRTTASDAEITGLCDAYLFWQRVLLDLEAEALPPAKATHDPVPHALHRSELAWTLQQIDQKREITPQPFSSRWPLIARFRMWWNQIATETYLRPLLQQQNDYNATLAEFAHVIERQRRTADGATMCQAMLLAKLIQPATQPHAHDRSDRP